MPELAAGLALEQFHAELLGRAARDAKSVIARLRCNAREPRFERLGCV
jgi:hypothetical protein